MAIKTMMNIHMPLNDLKSEKKLTLEIIIKTIKTKKYTALKISEVDHILNWKKIPTMNKIMRKILLRASK